MLRLLLTYADVCGRMRDTNGVFPAARAASSAAAVVVVDAAAAAVAARLHLHVRHTHPI